MRRTFALASIAFFLLLNAAARAEPDIQVNGLFAGRAMLTIDGNRRLLKVGSRSPEGVKLIASDSQQAVVEVEGRRLTLQLSQHISSSYRSVGIQEVRIPRGEGGHYFVGGNINGYSVRFLVDTGATAIAMNYLEAERLGINLGDSKRGYASTAGGEVETLTVTLPKVTVGGITLHRVPAAVLVGTHPRQILLGNSFLSRVKMTEEQGVMVLRK